MASKNSKCIATQNHMCYAKDKITTSFVSRVTLESWPTISSRTDAKSWRKSKRYTKTRCKRQCALEKSTPSMNLNLKSPSVKTQGVTKFVPKAMRLASLYSAALCWLASKSSICASRHQLFVQSETLLKSRFCLGKVSLSRYIIFHCARSRMQKFLERSSRGRR